METQKFEILVGAETHTVEITENARSGMAMIRVDGHIARSLPVGETTRDFHVGGDRYTAIRLGIGSFDVEPAEDLMKSSPPPQPRRRKRTWHIGGAVTFLAIVGIAAWILPGIRDTTGLGWYHFDAADRTYSFDMPVAPVKTHVKASGIEMAELAAASGGRRFFVDVADFSKSPAPGSDDLVIATIRDALLRRLHAGVLEEHGISSGVEIVARAPDENLDLKFRILLVPGRAYVVGAVTPRGDLGAPAVIRFLLMFRAADAAAA